jgi:hypothetical protein
MSKPLFKGLFALIFGGYLFSALGAPDEFHLIDSVNLIFHEAGHTILFFAPEVVTVLGGSVMQVLVPLSCALVFLLKREWFSASIVFMWMGYSIVNVSIYAGDAFARALPLLGGDGVVHDWAYLSAELGLGIHVLTLAKALRWIGIMTMILGFGASLLTVLRDIDPRTKQKDPLSHPHG